MKVKHCQETHCHNGVVDKFALWIVPRPSIALIIIKKKLKNWNMLHEGFVVTRPKIYEKK